MSQLCSTKFHPLTLNSKATVKLVLNRFNEINNKIVRDTLCQNVKGYRTYLPKSSISRIYPFYNLLNSFYKNHLFLSIKNHVNKNNKKSNNNWYQKFYKQNFGLVLSGFGLVIALCESSGFTRGEIYLLPFFRNLYEFIFFPNYFINNLQSILQKNVSCAQLSSAIFPN